MSKSSVNKCFRQILTLIFILSEYLCYGQNSCKVDNLWQNGTFESSISSCLDINSENAYSVTTKPWYGYTVLRWQPLTDLQPGYLNEANFDHTTKTKNGHYLYIDPRAKSGWDYEFRQKIIVEPNTDYTFSLWYCSMNKPGNPGANIRLTVNGQPVSPEITILNTNDKWIKISGVWNSGSSRQAVATLETYNAAVHGHDFAVDDVYFGSGKLIVDAGIDTVLCNPVNYSLGAKTVAREGVSCDNSYQYSWSPAQHLSDPNSAHPRLKTPVYNGYYVLTVFDEDGNTCSDSVMIQIPDVPQINLTDIPDTNICPDGRVVVDLDSIPSVDKVIWNDSDTSRRKTFTSQGTYSVRVLNQCYNRLDTFNIFLITDQPESFQDSFYFCENGKVIVNLPEKLHGLIWFDGEFSRTREFDSEGAYTFSYHETCLVFDDSISIFKLPLPVFDLGENDSMCVFDMQDVWGPPGLSSYLWNTGSTENKIIVNSPGLYFLTVTDSLGCSYTDSISFFILQKENLLLIPNAFSPNGDNLNEHFPAEHVDFDCNMLIYNRWGECLFDNRRNPELGKTWDGSYEGQLVQDGVYMYLISYHNCLGKPIYKKGTFHLVK